VASPYLFSTTGVTIATTTTVITHGLSVTASNLFFIITPSNVSTASCCVTKSTHGINTVTLSASVANTAVDLCVLQFHSIQGGPT